MDRNERRQVQVLAATTVWILATWSLQFVLQGGLLGDVSANLIEAASPAIAGVACWRVSRDTGKAAWRWFAGACAMWTIGSFAWVYYIIFLGNDLPFPSFADVGYLLTFPPAIVGALLLHDKPPRGADRVRTLLDALLVGGSLTVVLWWAILGAAHRGGNTFPSVLSVSYVVGDIAVLSLLVSAFRRSNGRRHDLLALTLGFGLLTAGDALFSYQEGTSTYGNAFLLPDLGWIGGFSLLGFAAFVAAHPSTQITHRRWMTTHGFRYFVLFGPYFAAVTVSADDLIRHGRLDGTQSWTAMALATIAFTRQVAGQIEKTQLTQSLELRVDELTHTQARFFTVFDESIEALALLDVDGRVQLASNQLLALLGLPAEHVVGHRGLPFIHADDQHAGIDLYTRVLGGEHSLSVVLRMLSPIGVRHVEMTLTNLLDNPAVNALLLGCRDITDRVRHEQVLEVSQSRFRAAFDHAPIGMVVIDSDGTINRLNTSLLTMLTTDESEILGAKFVDLAHPNDREILERVASPAVAIDGDVMRCEARLRRADGTDIWTTLSAVAVHAVDEPSYVIAQIEDVTDRREIARALEHNARHDPLTGAANRTLFTELLTEAIAASPHDNALAVAFVDIDRFKFVNDSLGHDAGDVLLRIVADRLRVVARERDVVARFGGDEFTMLLHDVTDARVALAIAERIEVALRQPVVLDDVETYITASVGLAISRPLANGIDPSEAADHLLRDADTAMYRAKEAGRSRTELFDEHRDRSEMNRLEIANALHRAVERDEFRVYYQPLVEVQSGEVYGFEALLRWEREPGHLVSPVDFINVAEDTGLIVSIGAWVLRTACEQAARWNETAVRDGQPPIMVSVNLSPRQFDAGDLVNTVSRAIESAGLAPDSLWLEITESALMRDTTSTIAVLRDLRRLGAHLSIDDFGTGYSSLSYLKRFPVEALKIDRSFTDGLGTEPEDTAIVTAVVGLAHALNMRAVAEGVETAEQLEHLRRLDCDAAQGYYLGYPLAAAALGDDPRARMRGSKLS